MKNNGSDYPISLYKIIVKSDKDISVHRTSMITGTSKFLEDDNIFYSLKDFNKEFDSGYLIVTQLEYLGYLI